jgi:hypothetical protein
VRILENEGRDRRCALEMLSVLKEAAAAFAMGFFSNVYVKAGR